MKLSENNPHVFWVKEQLKKKGGCSEIEMMYFYNYYNLAVSRFEWLNLPPEIEPFFIEDVMFYTGKGLFIHDDVADAYAFMRTALSGELDIYSIPSDRYAFANTGYLKDYDKTNSVILWDSPLAIPVCNDAWIYARSMANAWDTRDINMFAQRTPVVVGMTEDTKLSAENLIQKYREKVPVIKVNTSYSLDTLKALKLDAPYVVDKIETEMLVLQSQFLCRLGIESNPSDKKERLITDEVNGNNGLTEMYRNMSLATRKRFCNAANNMFGLNVDVRFRSELQTPINMGLNFNGGGGEV